MSAIARLRGWKRAPTFKGARNVPSPLPNSTLIRFASGFATAMSGRPSLLRSPVHQVERSARESYECVGVSGCAAVQQHRDAVRIVVRRDDVGPPVAVEIGRRDTTRTTRRRMVVALHCQCLCPRGRDHRRQDNYQAAALPVDPHCSSSSSHRARPAEVRGPARCNSLARQNRPNNEGASDPTSCVNVTGERPAE